LIIPARRRTNAFSTRRSGRCDFTSSTQLLCASDDPEGSLFGTFLVLLFTGRFLIEFTKLHHADFEAAWALNMGQLLSIPLVIFGAWLLIKRVDWKKQGR
jgi:prolipoprotein diacylglyceryltransferase